jgi:FimV-like protein
MVALNLARVYVASGRREQARQVLRDFLANSQGNAAAARALRQLEEP